MEKLFKNLAWKCYENDLRFEYIPTSTGIIIHTKDYQIISSGWINEGDIVLRRMAEEVNHFVSTNEQTRLIATLPKGITPEYQAMRDAGHKLSDFE